MIKYFYKLEYIIFHRFDEEDKENVEEKNLIGIFSSKLKAEKAIDECLKFETLFEENFRIKKYRITFEKYPTKIYFLDHEYAVHKANGEIIDYYYDFAPKATKEEALALYNIMRRRNKYKFCVNRDYSIYPPDGFIISDFEVDKIYFYGF